ncbi:MAG: flagellar hook-associated protein FlgK [Candidatus Lernaella stagnicola]|nr:flagellar hook-associated protein FlgK [Candidatus Lernaella stagnicola]
MGLANLMSIGVSSINAQQMAMEVTAHNIANINTPGYARQESIFGTRQNDNQGIDFRGAGVQISTVQRAEDRFFNRSVWLGMMDYNYYNARGTVLGEVEDMFNESSESSGMAATLSDFWSAWSDLANNPQGAAERGSLRGTSGVLASRFHITYQRLTSMQRSVDSEVKETVADINGVLRQLGDINARISSIENGGGDALDYRTVRNEYLSSLAEEIDFSYFELTDGSINLSTGLGRTLVESNQSAQLEVRANAANENLFDVYFVSSSGQEANITGEISGGRLGGMIYTRDTEVSDAKARLNEMAFTLVDEVNALHTTGFNLNGNTGINFFAPLATADDAARLIEIDPAIKADLNAIAAGEIDATGDNRIANLIGELRSVDVLSGGTQTLSEFYGTLVGEIGIETQNTKRQVQQTEAILYQLQTYRESQVGVSIEEEMANLVRYQQAYQAAARLINTASDLADILNNLRQ